MINIKEIYKPDSRCKDVYIWISDSKGFLNINLYTNKYDELAIKIERNCDDIHLCEPNKHDIQKALMLLLERDAYEKD